MNRPSPSDRAYRLLDSGRGRKLESVGGWVCDRQAPAAAWQPGRPREAWQEAVARHHRKDTGGGYWEYREAEPRPWTVEHGGLQLEVKPTPFGHLGLFAEQADQWDWLREVLRPATARSGEEAPEILNLFAYTGGSTLACSQAGARVCHVDAARGVVDWARRNAALNRLEERPLRWIVDDCLAFVERERRRGRRYQGLILDPPSFGRGARREVWKIEEKLPELLGACAGILEDHPRLLLLSCHTPGFTPLTLQNLLEDHFSAEDQHQEQGEMTVREEGRGRALPSGGFARWRSARHDG